MQMSPDKVLNLVSASVGAIGTFLMYKGTFGFAPVGSYMGAASKETIAANTRRERLQKCGLLLLTLSFALQGIAQFLPNS